MPVNTKKKPIPDINILREIEKRYMAKEARIRKLKWTMHKNTYHEKTI